MPSVSAPSTSSGSEGCRGRLVLQGPEPDLRAVPVGHDDLVLAGELARSPAPPPRRCAAGSRRRRLAPAQGARFLRGPRPRAWDTFAFARYGVGGAREHTVLMRRAAAAIDTARRTRPQGDHHGRRAAATSTTSTCSSATIPQTRSSPSRPRRSPASPTAPTRRRWPGRCYPDGIPIRPGGGARRPGARARRRRGRVRLLRRLVRDGDAQGVARARRRRRLRPARARRRRCSARRSRWSPCAPCAPAAARARRAARSGRILLDAGLAVGLIRHPMPYGDLEAMRVQRFATLDDIDASHPTIEEREEYERPVRDGDGRLRRRRLRGDPPPGRERGRRPDLGRRQQRLPVLRARPLDRRRRPAAARRTSSPTTRARRTCGWRTSSSSTRSTRAAAHDVEPSWRTSQTANPGAASSPSRRPSLDAGPDLDGQTVLVVEDGPTLTHGGMPFGAGLVAARRGRSGADRRSAAVRGRLDPRRVRAVSADRRPSCPRWATRTSSSAIWSRRSTPPTATSW